jgi:uncharacterized protein
MRPRALGLVLGLLAVSVAASASDEVPFLTGRVVDSAEILSPATRQRLAATLAAHERSTGNQIAVLTVPTIGGLPIEDYAARVFAGWKLGQKGKDNGVLVVVVPRDRKMRIEVGYGLEATLPDAMAGRIIRNLMTPAFKAGDYDKGVTDGVEAVVAVLEGHGPALPEASSSSSSAPTGSHFDKPDIPWPARILLGAFVFGIIGLFTVIGVMTPHVGWFMYLFLIPFWAIFPVIIIGWPGTLALLVTYLVCYPLAKMWVADTDWYRKAAVDLKAKGSASVGGFFTFSTSGSSSSGWSSDSSSSSGGFSGGGGSSGGGGASGSW